MHRLLTKKASKGFVITIVVIMVFAILAAGIAVLALGYNQKRLVDQVGAGQIRGYYRARAGIVNARWRIRTNNNGAGGYEYNVNPPAYSLDLDGDSVNDVTVDIGTENLATGLRDIVVTGRE